MSPEPERNAQLVVVVEDDDSLREMMRELLELAGFATAGCRNGREALAAALGLCPSAITLDLHMPGMDGVQVLQELARNEVTARVPVVVVSAYAADRRLRVGGQIKAVLQKPFDVDELCRTVRSAAATPELAPASDAAPPVSHEPRLSGETGPLLLSRYAV